MFLILRLLIKVGHNERRSIPCSYPVLATMLSQIITFFIKCTLLSQDKQDVLDTLGQNFIDDMNIIDEELDKIKDELKKLLNEFSAYAKMKYGDHYEIQLYSQLLDFETRRLEETKTEVRIMNNHECL